jgi:hypothetical protein
MDIVIIVYSGGWMIKYENGSALAPLAMAPWFCNFFSIFN